MPGDTDTPRKCQEAGGTWVIDNPDGTTTMVSLAPPKIAGGGSGSGGFNGGGSGRFATPPSSTPPAAPDEDEGESKACKLLREKAEAGRSSLPSRVTSPGTWSDPATLRFYQLTYQDRATDASNAAWLGTGVAVLVGLNFGANPKATGILGTSSNRLFSYWSDIFKARRDAIQNPLDYLESCAKGDYLGYAI